MKPAWEARNMWRSCTEKKKYLHEGQARREAHKYKPRAYKCHYCEGWHASSKEKK